MGLESRLANLDWITKSRALMETVWYGHGWTFYVDMDSGWCGQDCEDILVRHGILVYARMIADNDAFFQVPTRQAEYAEYLLLSAGAPLKYALFSERNARYLNTPGSPTTRGFLGLHRWGQLLGLLK